MALILIFQHLTNNNIKLICSAGHKYNTESVSDNWWKGTRYEGGKCPEVLDYDRMSKPATTKCNRKLKRALDEK